MRARRPAGQQQVGDVGARDSQQAARCAHQDEQQRVDISRTVFLERLEHEAVIRAQKLRSVGLAGCEKGVQIRARLCHRDAGFEPSEDRPGGHGAVAMAGSGRDGQRGDQVDLGVDGIDERLRKHANDCVRLRVESDDGADNVAAAVKAVAPESVGQQDRFGTVGEFLVRPERAAKRGRDREHVEEVGRDFGGVHLGRVRTAHASEGCVPSDQLDL